MVLPARERRNHLLQSTNRMLEFLRQTRPEACQAFRAFPFHCMIRPDIHWGHTFSYVFSSIQLSIQLCSAFYSALFSFLFSSVQLSIQLCSAFHSALKGHASNTQGVHQLHSVALSCTPVTFSCVQLHTYTTHNHSADCVTRIHWSVYLTMAKSMDW